MVESLRRYVKYVYIYGQDKQYIQEYIKDSCNYELCNNMHEALELANKKAQGSEIILLSPACASFDEFKNYVKRGEAFEDYVAQLKYLGS
jgi:UDP-N-acetylmuramoylalanine--D-glutamate ligase